MNPPGPAVPPVNPPPALPVPSNGVHSVPGPGVPNAAVVSTGGELLPTPYHGQGQYSHQMGKMPPTPGNSEPPSEKVSRTNTPTLPPANFDALEGQFTPNKSGTPVASGSPSPVPASMPTSAVPNVISPLAAPIKNATNNGNERTLTTGMPHQAQTNRPSFPPSVQPGLKLPGSFPLPPSTGVSSLPRGPGASIPPLAVPSRMQAGGQVTPQMGIVNPPSTLHRPPGFQSGAPPRVPPPGVITSTGPNPFSPRAPSCLPSALPSPMPPNGSSSVTTTGLPPMPPSFTAPHSKAPLAPGSAASSGPSFLPPPSQSFNTIPGVAPGGNMPLTRPPTGPPVDPGSIQSSAVSLRPPISGEITLPPSIIPPVRPVSLPPPVRPVTSMPPTSIPAGAISHSQFTSPLAGSTVPPTSPPTAPLTASPQNPINSSIPGPRGSTLHMMPQVPIASQPGSMPPTMPPSQPSAVPNYGQVPSPNPQPLGSRPPYPGMPPPPTVHSVGATQMPGPPSSNTTATQNQLPPPGSSRPNPGMMNGMSNSPAPVPTDLNSRFNQMTIEPQQINLLAEKNVIPADGLQPPKPQLHAYGTNKVNCSSDIFRCTLSNFPNTQSLLNKARLPLGLLIHPFKDLSSLPVIQTSVIVRCRSCRTYINPFVRIIDQRKWQCNMCYRNNELPDDFSYDPVSKSYGDPSRRPEIRSATIEFIAPSEYMLRPPQPAVYIFLLDISYNAVEKGYLSTVCSTILDELDSLPGDARTMVSFICYDSCLRFFNLFEELSQPQMMIVSDVEDVYLPCPDGLLVNLRNSKELIQDLLRQIPTLFEDNRETHSALGAALQAAYKLAAPTGGRISVFQTVLPSVGPGALQSRDDSSMKASQAPTNLGPATDFYKKLALECSGSQVGVDLFMLNSQHVDMATLGGVAKFSSGSLYYYPGFHYEHNPVLVEKLEADLRRYLTRKIGFEAVLRLRCTKGLSIHTFHGNFFVRSTDLLSLANVNPDAGFAMQMSIEDNLDVPYASFQAALLYTASKGERRIRIHTICLPVVSALSEVYQGADTQAIVGLISKMAVDRTLSSGLRDAREAITNAAVDLCGAFGQLVPAAQRIGTVQCPYALRTFPLYCLALLKMPAFRTGGSTSADERIFSMEDCKTLPLQYLMLRVYPKLYPFHLIDVNNTKMVDEIELPVLPELQLNSSVVERHSLLLMDRGDMLMLWIGSCVNPDLLNDVFGADGPESLDEPCDLPDLENRTSVLIRNFIALIQDQRPFHSPLVPVLDSSQRRHRFLQYMIDDRSENMFSYYEFLQHIQKEIS